MSALSDIAKDFDPNQPRNSENGRWIRVNVFARNALGDYLEDENGKPLREDVVHMSREAVEESFQKDLDAMWEGDKDLTAFHPSSHGPKMGIETNQFHESISNMRTGPAVLVRETGSILSGDLEREVVPLKEVFRGVSAEEYDQAIKRGYILSDERGVIVPGVEGTNAGHRLNTANSYLPRNGEGYILKILVDEDDGWFSTDDGYYRTRKRIPIDRVVATTKKVTLKDGFVVKYGDETGDSISKANPLWDGDGVQGVGQLRDFKGRWAKFKLPGASKFGKLFFRKEGDGEYAVYNSDVADKEKRIKTFKTRKGALDFIQRQVDQDMQDEDAYDEIERQDKARANARVRSARERRKVQAIPTSPSVGAPSNVVESAPKSDIVVTQTERAELPRPATSLEVQAANKTTAGMPTNELKYARMITRLSNKGITQDPKRRGDINDKYGISPKRQVQIEQSMYDEIYGKDAEKKKETRSPNLRGRSPFMQSAQKEAMKEQGARKGIALEVPYGDKFTRPNRLFKATKGKNKGKWVIVDSNGKSRTTTDSMAAKLTKKGDEYWKSHHEKHQKALEKSRSQYRARQRELIDEHDLNKETTKKSKIIIAQKWAKDQGLDPDDSSWWAFYHNDPTLLKVQDGSGAPKTKEYHFKTPLAQRDPLPPREVKSGPSRRRKKELAESKEPTNARRTKINEEKEEAAKEIAEPKQRSIRVSTNRKTGEKKTVSRRPAANKTAGEKKTTARAPKREKLTFDMQSGLPLLPESKKPNKKYEPVKFAPSVKQTPRKATKKDIAELEARGIKIGNGHVNIRVPIDSDKSETGFGTYEYMYDKVRVKDGALETDTKAYTQSHVIARQNRKFIRIANIAEHMPKLDSRLRKESAKDDVAGAVSLMRILGMRPSSESGGETKVRTVDEAGNVSYVPVTTYGVTSMQQKHVSISGNTATISLTGKAAHEINIVTDDPIVVNAIKGALSRNKGKPEDRVFPVAPAKTLAYIKETMIDAQNKDMRTYVATAMATQLVANMKAPTTPAEFRNAIKDVTETTANQLQHNPSMSLNSYIAPSVFMQWSHSAGIDYDLFENPRKGNARQIKPLGWEEISAARERRKAERKK